MPICIYLRIERIVEFLELADASSKLGGQAVGDFSVIRKECREIERLGQLHADGVAHLLEHLPLAVLLRRDSPRGKWPAPRTGVFQ